MKFIAGIVLYNPEEKNLLWIKELNYKTIFDKILIYDNSKDNHVGFFSSEKITYITNQTNDGLSKPYNRMIEISINENADYLCLLDQDSDYSPEEINNMILFLRENTNSVSDSVIIAPRSYAVNTPRVERGNYLTSVDYAINSGSFLQLRLIKKTELRYDEHIFLDGVDFEFGWQIRDLGYKISIYEDSVYEQNLGYKLGEDDRFTHHNAFRYYLITKNRRYIYRKHCGIVKGSMFAAIKNIFLCGRILWHEDNKIEKMISCIKGMTCWRV
ncbi:glycosyltransferase [Blautia sp. HCP3S3_G3]|uniref:glycosyltransferase n=1 Tax=Blautia sp. HCP3S3_G3 TaxID=3438913 RepID=UPI003F8CEEA0